MCVLVFILEGNNYIIYNVYFVLQITCVVKIIRKYILLSSFDGDLENFLYYFLISCKNII